MNKRMTIVSALLVLSLAGNIFFYMKSETMNRYKTAAELAIDHFTSGYKIRSLHESMVMAQSEQKLVFGESGRFYNTYQADLKQISSMHFQLTLLYGPISDYEHYNRISSFGSGTLFNLLEDSAVFFYLVGERYRHSPSNDGEIQFVRVDQLDEDIADGIKIITEITGELESIWTRSFANKEASDIKALQQYLMESADYIHTPEVQAKAKRMEELNQALQLR